MDESALIAGIARSLRSSGWTVLACRPSQTRLWFQTATARRKAPDLVAVRGASLIVAEAKLAAAELFRGGAGSDCEQLVSFLASGVAKEEFSRKVVAQLAASRAQWSAREFGIHGVLFARNAFTEAQLCFASPLPCVSTLGDDFDGAANALGDIA